MAPSRCTAGGQGRFSGAGASGTVRAKAELAVARGSLWPSVRRSQSAMASLADQRETKGCHRCPAPLMGPGDEQCMIITSRF